MSHTGVIAFAFLIYNGAPRIHLASSCHPQRPKPGGSRGSPYNVSDGQRMQKPQSAHWFLSGSFNLTTFIPGPSGIPDMSYPSALLPWSQLSLGTHLRRDQDELLRVAGHGPFDQDLRCDLPVH